MRYPILALATAAVLVAGCGHPAQPPTQDKQGGMSCEIGVSPDSHSGLPSPAWVTVRVQGGSIVSGRLVLLDSAGETLAHVDLPAGSYAREQLAWSSNAGLGRRLTVTVTAQDASGTVLNFERTLTF